jgi:putative ABC transport system ATP-binding protein
MTLQLRDVRKTYGRDVPVVALNGVSASFDAGTFTAVMGPSGSGKSTLLHCAAGLDRADSGEIVLAGTSLSGLDETALTLLRRDRVGFVFQSFNLVPSLTASQNVALPMRLAGRKPTGAEVAAALSEVGLGARAEHYPSELSGGEQQRVAIARALLTRPAVLFADEPTGALDSQTSRGVLALLRQLVDQEQQTLILVTHDPVAAGYADRTVRMEDGVIAC